MIIEKVSAWGGEYVEIPKRDARDEWRRYYQMARKQCANIRVWWHTGEGLSCAWVNSDGISKMEAKK